MIGKAMIFSSEREAIRAAVLAGQQYGYGNIIAHLKRRWAEELVQGYGMTEESALRAADVPAYPLKARS